MAVWDELRVILAWLRDQQPSLLLQGPDPHCEEAPAAPFQITLAPSAVTAAEDLHRRFGDRVRLTVGCLPYPPDRGPGPPGRLARPLPGRLIDPREAEVHIPGPVVVRSGQTLHHRLLVRNPASQVLSLATNGQVTAVVVDLETEHVVGGFAGAQTQPLVTFRIAPGASEQIPLLIGTASFAPVLGYAVPPGSWGIQVPLVLHGGMRAGEQRRTAVSPLTVTS